MFLSSCQVSGSPYHDCAQDSDDDNEDAAQPSTAWN